MDKLQKIKDDFCPFDENYNLYPSEIKWLFEHIDELKEELGRVQAENRGLKYDIETLRNQKMS